MNNATKLLQQEGINIEFLEDASKRSKNPDFLNRIVEENYANATICVNVARNRYAGSKTLEALAFHPEGRVRLEVAQRAEVLTSAKSLMRLAYDPCLRVRLALARRTSNEAIKMLLLKSSKSNLDIIKECLRRIKDEKRVIEYITTSSSSKKPDFIDAAFDNAIMTEDGIYCLIKSSQCIYKRSITKLGGVLSVRVNEALKSTKIM